MKLHKLLIFTLKVIPWLLVFIYLIGTIFSSLGIDLLFLSYFGFVSLIPWLFILLSSFVFKFCIWHRFPLYFIFINNILNYIIWVYIGISFGWILVSSLITVSLLILIYTFIKNKEHVKIRNIKKSIEKDS